MGVEPLPFYRHLNQNRLEGTLLAIDLEDMKLGKVKLLLAYYLEFPGSLFRNIAYRNGRAQQNQQHELALPYPSLRLSAGGHKIIGRSVTGSG